MVSLFAILAAVLHLGAGILLVSDLRREGDGMRAVARFAADAALVSLGLLGTVVLVSQGAIGLLRASQVGIALAMVLGAGTWALRFKASLRPIAVITLPLCGLLLLFSAFESQRPLVEDGGVSPLILVHIGLVLVGLGSFGLGSALSGLYLIQEHQLRRRSFGPLFQRLPSLEELDAASFRLVCLGFVAFSVAILLGGIAGATLDARIALSALAWICFAAVLHTRLMSGWRGRASAWMTVVGFGVALVAVSTYVFAGGAG